MTGLDELTSWGRDTFELGVASEHRRLRDLADRLVRSATPDQLERIALDTQGPLDLRLAGKLAESKRWVTAEAPTGRIGIVFAMWGERNRLRPRSDDNPTGEDSLHVKLDSLHWLLAETDLDWRVFAVDDGDPDDSAGVAEDRAQCHEYGHRVQVLRLSDALPADGGPLAGLADADGSRKGGAIVHGADRARVEGCGAVILTDADNSVDLGQIGLLLASAATGADVVIGDRKHPQSVLVKAEARWGPGIVVLRHMQRMVGRALFERGLTDTQAAFKLYAERALDPILEAPSTYGFAFDSDWLYAAVASGCSIARVPFAFIDSFEESASITQGPMTTWESLLQGLATAARARGVDHHEAMAAVVDRCARADILERVVQAVPPQLAGVADADLGDPELLSPADLEQWIESLPAPGPPLPHQA
jgi:hypothetical protein